MKNSFLFCLLVLPFFSFTPPASFISLFENPQIIEMDATLNKGACNNKAFIPIQLPEGAKGWIYSINAVNKAEAETPTANLLQQVEKLAYMHEAEKIADFIQCEEQNQVLNLYILQGKKEADAFNNCGSYTYIQKHLNIKPRAGFVKNKGQDTFYIGIEKSEDLKKLRLKVEVVAVM